METTLIILKPDAVQRGLVGRITTRFEEKGLQIVGLKLMRITPELAPSPAPAADPRAEARIARWFDVKEHVASFGFALALALALTLAAWAPRDDGDAIATVVVGFAWVTAGSTWLCAIIGAVVTMYRSV